MVSSNSEHYCLVSERALGLYQKPYGHFLLPPWQKSPVPQTLKVFYVFWWDWCLTQSFMACKAGTLLFEPHLQSILLCLFWIWDLENYLPRISLIFITWTPKGYLYNLAFQTSFSSAIIKSWINLLIISSYNI
jgi:hypothetical protein